MFPFFYFPPPIFSHFGKYKATAGLYFLDLIISRHEKLPLSRISWANKKSEIFFRKKDQSWVSRQVCDARESELLSSLLHLCIHGGPPVRPFLFSKKSTNCGFPHPHTAYNIGRAREKKRGVWK